MEIIYRDLSQLKKLPNNPRKIASEDLERLKESLLANGDYFECRPIILSDRTGELVIIAGNQRYEAALQLGWDKVPTVLLQNLTEEREREIIIRDNVSNGEWDSELLKEWDSELLSDWGVEVDWKEDEKKSSSAVKDLSDKIQNEYKIEVTCCDESEQREVFEEMEGRGFRCKVLIL